MLATGVPGIKPFLHKKTKKKKKKKKKKKNNKKRILNQCGWLLMEDETIRLPRSRIIRRISDGRTVR